MKRLRTITLLLAALTASSAAHARDQIRVVGSSTVYPFITIAAEQFGRGTDYKTPVVESIGTGGGFKMFCSGVGDSTPDINNASRKIKDSEVESCKKNGVEGIVEIPIGYDGIVLAMSKKGTPFALTRKQLFLALGKKVPKNGKLVDNPYTNWNEIDGSLPAFAIKVYGPPPTSGTRDAFVELAFEEVCSELPEAQEAYADKEVRKKSCHMVREDGAFIEAGEDDNMIVRKLEFNPEALGILGYSFVEENTAIVQPIAIDGVMPTFDNIADGDYKLARLLYVYIKNAHVKTVPGLKAFAREITLEGAMGPDGYMARKGLIPMDVQQREKTRAEIVGL